MGAASTAGLAGRERLFRAGLLVVAVSQAGVGVYALLAPRSFHADFPFGRGWVSALGSYDEHLVRDVGASFTALTVLLVLAAVYLELRLVQAALAAWLVFSVPHLLFHLTTVDEYGLLDNVATLLGLAVQVVLPAALLLLTFKQPANPPAP